ncbi:hypothetical protein GWI33_000447 [Rhynchophorus ferrugineus]|uniref:Uncharacterized protein n=1 Tax=Rhynchophorus ferrugineus TaxID=354439 RepID=A0A834M291_RHYFE|nr:hypothetical protein GWI33_000452 [Rhynchophorus ferrugineus]KAF7264230.1 hypothetical protein GWI33_000447 [Rhynchophorus ferrugineus]
MGDAVAARSMVAAEFWGGVAMKLLLGYGSISISQQPYELGILKRSQADPFARRLQIAHNYAAVLSNRARLVAGSLYHPDDGRGAVVVRVPHRIVAFVTFIENFYGRAITNNLNWTSTRSVNVARSAELSSAISRCADEDVYQAVGLSDSCFMLNGTSLFGRPAAPGYASASFMRRPWFMGPLHESGWVFEASRVKYLPNK